MPCVLFIADSNPESPRVHWLILEGVNVYIPRNSLLIVFPGHFNSKRSSLGTYFVYPFYGNNLDMGSPHSSIRIVLASTRMAYDIAQIAILYFRSSIYWII